MNLHYAPGRSLSRTMPTIRDDATVSASDETVDWIERQHETVDGMDMDEFLSFMAEEAQFRFGNNEPARGHDQIRGAIGEFWDSIEDLHHEFTGIWEQDDVVVLEASIRYETGRRSGIHSSHDDYRTRRRDCHGFTHLR